MIKKINDIGHMKRTYFMVVVGIITLVFFYSFIYNDILETMRVGIGFWDELFFGDIRYFYANHWEMTPVAYTKEVQAVYDFPIYIIFAIWNFPLWLLERYMNVDIFNSVLCLMWGKTLLLLAVVLITWAIYRLCKTLDLNKDMSKLVCVLFLSSNFFMTSVVMMSAYDIIALYFAIEGINYYFKDNNKGFIICFMCAIPLKFFALLIFVPLVLLKEKRIPHIVGYIFLSVLPILIFRLLIPCGARYGQPETVIFNLVNMFKSTELSNLSWIYALCYQQPMTLDHMYPSVFAWIILFLVCYFSKIKDKKQLKQWGIYMCFVSYMILFTLCMSHPYWILIIVPLTSIIMGQNYKYLYTNMILETIFTWGMIFAQIFKFPWCFGSAIVSGMFWPSILGKQEYFQPTTIMTVYNSIMGTDNVQEYLIGIGDAIFLATILLFAIINFPGWKRELPLIKGNGRSEKWLFIVRVGAGFILALIPLGLYIIGLHSI